MSWGSKLPKSTQKIKRMRDYVIIIIIQEWVIVFLTNQDFSGMTFRDFAQCHSGEVHFFRAARVTREKRRIGSAAPNMRLRPGSPWRILKKDLKRRRHKSPGTRSFAVSYEEDVRPTGSFSGPLSSARTSNKKGLRTKGRPMLSPTYWCWHGSYFHEFSKFFLPFCLLLFIHYQMERIFGNPAGQFDDLP